jgi:hypothetical protein
MPFSSLSADSEEPFCSSPSGCEVALQSSCVRHRMRPRNAGQYAVGVPLATHQVSAARYPGLG